MCIITFIAPVCCLPVAAIALSKEEVPPVYSITASRADAIR
jgi:hypothetical protein